MKSWHRICYFPRQAHFLVALASMLLSGVTGPPMGGSMGLQPSIWPQRLVAIFCRLIKLPYALAIFMIYIYILSEVFFWFSRKMCKLSTKWGSSLQPNILLLRQPPCLCFHFSIFLRKLRAWTQHLSSWACLVFLPKEHILHVTPEKVDPGGRHTQTSHNKWIQRKINWGPSIEVFWPVLIAVFKSY